MSLPSAKKVKVEGTDSPLSVSSQSSLYSSDSSLGSTEKPDRELDGRGWLYALSPISFLVWPSKMQSEAAFLDFIKLHFFKVSLNVDFYVKVEKTKTELFPIKQCDECKLIFEKSGLIEAFNKVNWGLVGVSTYNLDKEVSFLLSYLNLMLFLC